MAKLKIYFRCILYLLFLFISDPLWSQFQDSFEAGLEQWSGDTEDFRVNDDQMLQLNASSSGISLISTQFTYPEKWEFRIHLKMDFSPSDNNRTRIYLYSDGTDQSTYNGYFLNFGENGSNDAIQLFSISEGAEELLGSATMGAISSDPVDLGISLSYDDGFWQLNVDYEGGELYIPELEVLDESFTRLNGLALECKYTSTRTDLFFFDNISVDVLELDNSPPGVVNAFVQDERTLGLIFNELLDEITGSDPGNYSIPETGNMASSATVDKNEVEIQFLQAFESGPGFSILINGIEDLNGNVVDNERSPVIFYAIPPGPGDIIINEILFDPFPGEEDFLEIYNKSEKLINLQGLGISNVSRGDMEVIDRGIIVQPGAYLALTPRAEDLLNVYPVNSDALIESSPLPAFNNESGNVTLIYDGQLLDEFNYDEDFHSPIINDTEGVSLERISPETATESISNWTSGQETNGFATPGYQNGALISSVMNEENISLRNGHFSPDGDSNMDYAILDYNLDKAGYLATVNVFNDAGQKVRELANNISLSTNGFLQWDGITNEGKIGRIGVYIISIELFHPDGETIQEQKAIALLRQVD